MNELFDVHIFGIATPLILATTQDITQKHFIHHDGFVFSGAHRDVRRKTGAIDIVATDFCLEPAKVQYRFGAKKKEERGFDFAVIPVAPMDNKGYFNIGGQIANTLAYAKSGKKLVVEVREDLPWAVGEHNTIHIDEVDYIYECNLDKWGYQKFEITLPKPSEEEQKIAEHIGTFLHDGDCMQIGYGPLPSAVGNVISRLGLKHLGVHTEMMNEGVMDLIEAGCVDNSRKNLNRGKSVWTFCWPFSKRLYEAINYNPSFLALSTAYVNNPFIIAQQDHMASVNSFAMIDLYGQVTGERIGEDQISGTGGCFDFTMGSLFSKGGRAFLAHTSCYVDSQGKKHSRIVPRLPVGSIITIPRNLVSYVVTEYGVVNLFGLSDYERAMALISIAHPDFREELEKEARKLKNLPPEGIRVEWPPRNYPPYRHDYKIAPSFVNYEENTYYDE